MTHSQDQNQQKAYQERVIQARFKLMQRFKKQMADSPSLSDDQPLGTGPQNRHGMPQLPVGQVYTKKWPVLDLGICPTITTDAWRLTVDGAAEKPYVLSWDDMLVLEQVEDTSDFHCVTTWSKVNMRWKGVRVSSLLALAQPHENVTHVMCYGSDGYTTNVQMSELLKDDVLLVHTYEDQPLSKEHGGPARLITPQLYAWKGAKWICRMELMTENRLGFWEQRGYSDTAYPWRNDRYS